MIKSFSATTFPYQEHLEKALRGIFPGYNIIQNAKKEGEVRSTETGRWLELDFWIPELNVAFEFQDPHHYASTGYSNATLESVQERDYIKSTQMTERGGSLITIPCWWDGSIESLVETIRISRPDLVTQWEDSSAKPIPSFPADNFFDGKLIPHVGELMQATFSDCAVIFPNIWWISEKYDGIRACWHPQLKKLYSKYASELHVRLPFDDFPASFLDGELWLGRSTFREVRQISSLIEENSEWSNLRYILFDSPTPSAPNEPFEKRISELASSVPATHQVLTFAPLYLCKGRTHLIEMTNLVISAGGEGTVLRLRGSPYRNGVSTELLKYKAHRRDYEAVVIRIEGANFVLQMKNGVTFSTADNLCAEPINIGDVVTFSFSNFTNLGSPVDPILIKLRPDIAQETVLYNSSEASIINSIMGRAFQSITPRKAHGHWTRDSAKNVKLFFDSLQKSRGKDPLRAENWYSVTHEDIIAEEGGYSVLSQYNNSLVRALKDAYPETSFDDSQFASRKVWHIANRRQILDKFAQKCGFDSLVSENWYNINESDLSHDQEFASLVRYRYGGSIAKAVMDIYTKLSFEEDLFMASPRKQWNWQSRKQFFDEFAHANGFDPLVSTNWYSISSEKLLHTKNGVSVMDHYNGSYIKALAEVYPTVYFDQSNFIFKPKNYWEEKHNRKKFFDSFAASKGFDPLVPENWYTTTTEEIAEKGGHSILSCYSGSAVKALLDVYPNIDLDKSKFSTNTRKTWHFTHRKAHFDQFAARHSFDPLVTENWLNVSPHLLWEDKHISSIVKFCYNSSFRKAISNIYP